MTLSAEERKVLIRSAEHLLKKYASRFASQWSAIAIEEFHSIGAVGLASAAANYDPSIGVPFPFYAKKWIWGKMNTLATTTTYGGDALSRALYGCVEYVEAPRDLGIAALLEFSAEEARNDTVNYYRKMASSMGTAALIAGYHGRSPERTLMALETSLTVAKVVEETMLTLEPKEREAIVRTVQEGRTLAEVATEMEVSTKTIQRLVKRAKEKLAQALKEAGIDIETEIV